MPVSLSDVASELEPLGDGMSAYLHPATGAVRVLTELDDADPDDPGLPDWQRESAIEARAILASDDWLVLPTPVDMDDYQIMARFCGTVSEAQAARLEDAIRGSGAFHQFRAAVERLDLLDAWYTFKRRSYETAVARWLDARDIPFER